MKKLFILAFGLIIALPAMANNKVVTNCGYCHKGNNIKKMECIADLTAEDKLVDIQCTFFCKDGYVNDDNENVFTIIDDSGNTSAIAGFCNTTAPCNNCNDFWSLWGKTGACADAAMINGTCAVTKCPTTAKDPKTGKIHNTYMKKVGNKKFYTCVADYGQCGSGKQLHTWTENNTTYTDGKCVSATTSETPPAEESQTEDDWSKKQPESNPNDSNTNWTQQTDNYEVSNQEGTLIKWPPEQCGFKISIDTTKLDAKTVEDDVKTKCNDLGGEFSNSTTEKVDWTAYECKCKNQEETKTEDHLDKFWAGIKKKGYKVSSQDSTEITQLPPKHCGFTIYIKKDDTNTIKEYEVICKNPLFNGDKLSPFDESIEGYIGYKCECPPESAAQPEDDADTSSNNGQPADAETIVKNAVSELDTLTKFTTNKWRNADGKFNTARLASDLTAGVVLGTAGALITSSLVKKSQLESGFEDIQCSISGQTVAEFGDEFTVGIK